MADLKGYEQLQARLRAVSGTNLGDGLMRQLGNAAVREQKLLVHRKTGTTARTIHVSNVTSNSVTTAAAAAAMWLEKGTKAHVIKPRVAKALFFASQKATTERFGEGAKLKFRLSGALTAASMRRFGNAAFVHAKIVHHPGTAAYPFMEPGAKAALDKAGLAQSVVKLWNDAA